MISSRREPVEFLRRRREQLEPVYPGAERRAALGAGRPGGDDLVEPEPRRVVDGPDEPVVRHGMGVDEAVGRRLLDQRDPRLGQAPVGGRQRGAELAARGDPRSGAVRVRAGHVDRAELLGIPLMQAAGDREVRVDPDVHAAAEGLAAVGAADDDERLLVLPEHGIEQLGLVGRARLPVGPDEGHRARVLRGQLERVGEKLADTVGITRYSMVSRSPE